MHRVRESPSRPRSLSRPTPKEVLKNDRDRLNLQDLYEAYLVFCENGSHRIAWRNLAVLLTVYLCAYFPHKDGVLVVTSDPTRAPRIRYITNLDIPQLGYLTKDVLWVLFRFAGFIPTDDEVLLCRTRSPVMTRDYLLILSFHSLQLLLAEITNELNQRTLLNAFRHNKSIGSLSPPWSPCNGTNLGILRFVDVELSPDDVTLLLRFRVKEQPSPKAPEAPPETIFDLPKKLLRRALSVGSGTSSKGNRAKSHRNSFLGDIDPKLVSAAYTTNKPNLGRRSTTDFSITVPKALRTPTAKPVPGPIVASTNPFNFFPAPSRTLTSITEESTGDGQTLVEDEGWFSSDSEETSQSIDTSFDFLENETQSKQTSKRNSLEPASAIRLVDDRASLDSTATKSIKSGLSSHQSFITARTQITIVRESSRTSKRTSIDTFVSLTTPSADPLNNSAYKSLLNEYDLIPDTSIETNWSDRGQHVEFEDRADVPLQLEKVLGRTRNALVESVRCKRVRLVRKTMRCTKWSGLKREDALREVQHLYRLQHSHIVRLVGTYVIGAELSILTYPCAEWNLEQFMELTRTMDDSAGQSASLRRFFTCLAKVLDFMHSYPLKHMDIKPQNLLVRDVRNSNVHDTNPYKIYFTDFGISRSYESIEQCETETPTSFTRTYAALEVVLQEARDLSADIFSLGCVFVEMLATILDAEPCRGEVAGAPLWETLRTVRQRPEGGLRPYHATTEQIRIWLEQLPIHEPELGAVRTWTMQMLQTDARKRPAVRQIADDPHLPFPCQSCTMRSGPEDFEAAGPLTPCPTPHIPVSIIEVPNPPSKVLSAV